MRYRVRASLLASVSMVLAASAVPGAVIIATGQNNGDPSHASGLFYYSINTATGIATPLAPITGGNSAGLAGTPDGRLLGFRSNRVVEINPQIGAVANVGSSFAPFSTTSLDVIHDGRIFATPVSGDTRLHRLDPVTGTATPVGAPNSIGAALDAFYGLAANTLDPFIIGLGSVARRQNIGTVASPNFVTVSTLYGINLDETAQLVAINPDTGFASVVGALGSVDGSGNPGAGKYSGFAAATGVDEDGDGLYDSLYGNVNFFDPDGSGPLASQRFGGVAKYNLNDGTYTLVGNNPGLIFFGFGSAIPEPAALGLLAPLALGLIRPRR